MLYVVPDKKLWLRQHPLEVAIVLVTPPFLPPSLEAARVFRLLRLLVLVRAAVLARRLFSLEGLRDAAVHLPGHDPRRAARPSPRWRRISTSAPGTGCGGRSPRSPPWATATSPRRATPGGRSAILVTIVGIALRHAAHRRRRRALHREGLQGREDRRPSEGDLDAPGRRSKRISAGEGLREAHLHDLPQPRRPAGGGGHRVRPGRLPRRAAHCRRAPRAGGQDRRAGPRPVPHARAGLQGARAGPSASPTTRRPSR